MGYLTLAEAEKKFHIFEKWPCCIITGEPITHEQAMQIIWRTDRMMDAWCMNWNGNDKDWAEWFCKIMKAPKKPNYNGLKGDALGKAINKDGELCKHFNSLLGHIDLKYLYNDQINSNYICGPHGWCHPDGYIGYSDNIGKWPSVEEIHQELHTIAKAFPFLTMSVTIMDGEDGYYEDSVISYEVSNGEVKILDTPIPASDLNPNAGQNPNKPFVDKDSEDYLLYRLMDNNSEHDTFTKAEIASWQIPTYDVNGNLIPDKFYPKDYPGFRGEE